MKNNLGKSHIQDNAIADFEKTLLQLAASQNDAYPKALANYMFREIIEDAHAKYNISQDDMKTMCKAAVDRAAMFFKLIDEPQLYKAFVIYAAVGEHWDDAEITDEILEQVKTLERLATCL